MRQVRSILVHSDSGAKMGYGIGGAYPRLGAEKWDILLWRVGDDFPRILRKSLTPPRQLVAIIPRTHRG